MIRFWIKNLLAIGLLAGSTSAFSQAESFNIECKVSGTYLGRSMVTISDQPILVTVDHKPPTTSVKVEGGSQLNVGTVNGKPGQGKFSTELIDVSLVSDSEGLSKLAHVKINRATGFIEIFTTTNVKVTKSTSILKVSGFCQKASNKPKF